MQVELSFSEKLGDLIAEKGNGQTNGKIAEEIGINPSMLSKYLSDREPRIEALVKIARYFGVSTDYLLGLSTEKSLNTDMRTAEHTTGLSKKAIENIQGFKDADKSGLMFPVLNEVLESPAFTALLVSLQRLKSRCLTGDTFSLDDAKQKQGIEKLRTIYGDEPVTGEETAARYAIQLHDSINGCLHELDRSAENIAYTLYPVKDTLDWVQKIEQRYIQERNGENGW